MKQYILALDQGTTSSRCIVFDAQQNIISSAQREFPQIFPKAGWVEHDPFAILSSQLSVMEEALSFADVPLTQVAAIGITNQRETTIIWEKKTGKPIYNAIVWQCRRTAQICEEIKELAPHIQQTTGLVLDAYFSATKVKWILDNVAGARERAKSGELLFGTVDTWLLWNLTKGAVHATDHSNASRTMLYDIHNLCWDDTLLQALDIPACMLPEVRSSSDIYGYAEVFGNRIPVSGIAGDQQAALFGQACFHSGQAKNTYGTGCFLLMHTGESAITSKNNLLTTLAATCAQQPMQYALEGSVFMGGAVIQWMRDEMRFFANAADSEYFATRVSDSGGVYFVPAFTGLGAPHWDMYARGTITGLTRGSNANHIIRAGLEAIAFQTNDVLRAMESDMQKTVSELKVDGGASANNFLMQFQSDISRCPVLRPRVRETTALGAAYLAGLSTGIWNSKEEIEAQWTLDQEFNSALPTSRVQELLRGWQNAIQGVMTHGNE